MAGFSIGIFVVATLKSFTNLFQEVGLSCLLAALSTVLVAALIGIVDDLISLRQWVKALAPMLSTLPLMAVKAGDATQHPSYGDPRELCYCFQSIKFEQVK